MVAPALTQVGVSPGCRAHVHLLLRGAFRSQPTDGPFSICCCGDHRCKPISNHDGDLEIHDTGIRGAVCFTLAPDGMGLLMKAPAGTILWTSLTAALGVAALAFGAGGWLKQRQMGTFLAIAGGLSLIYPSFSFDAFGNRCRRRGGWHASVALSKRSGFQTPLAEVTSPSAFRQRSAPGASSRSIPRGCAPPLRGVEAHGILRVDEIEPPLRLALERQRRRKLLRGRAGLSLRRRSRRACRSSRVAVRCISVRASGPGSASTRATSSVSGNAVAGLARPRPSSSGAAHPVIAHLHGAFALVRHVAVGARDAAAGVDALAPQFKLRVLRLQHRARRSRRA